MNSESNEDKMEEDIEEQNIVPTSEPLVNEEPLQEENNEESEN